MDKKIVIKNYDDHGVVISVQDKMANGTFGSSSDVELSHEELRGLSFQEVMDVVCGDVWERVPMKSFIISYILMKKNLIIIGAVIFLLVGFSITWALRDTEKSLNASIKKIRADRETMYDSCLQSCMDKRTPYDNRVVEKQNKLKLLKK